MISILHEPEITVGILTEKSISFDFYGDYKSPGFSQNFSGRFSAEVINDKIVLKRGAEKFEVQSEIIFEPYDFGIESFLLKDVTIGSQFHWQRKERQRFTGILKLIKNEKQITVLNILPLENYLTSVISSEMSSKSELQLLMAHAVVSRSWILAQMEKSKQQKKEKSVRSSQVETESERIKWYDRKDHKLFDVCADDHCQRYQGITKIFTDNVRRAIEETRGIVLMSNNKICDTRYSKSCGGISEAFENVWEPVKHDYLSSIVDYKFEPENYNIDFSNEFNAVKWIKQNPQAYCNTTDKKILSQVLVDYDQETKDFFRWKVEYSQKEIAEIIHKKSGIDFGEIIELIPLQRGSSARLVKLKIVGTKKTMVIGKELEIRKTLSETHLYSSAIVIDISDVKKGIPQKFVISGAGWGHGVGLCQIGAAVMAERGHQFDEILLHYFAKAKLKKIY